MARRTVYKWIGKIKRKETIKRKAGSGRKRKLTPPDCKYLRRMSLINDRFSDARLATRLFQARSLKVSHVAIRRKLQRIGLNRLSPNPVPLMTYQQQQKRLVWCIKHRNYNCNNVVFSDESRFQLYGSVPKLICKKNQRKFIPRPKHSPAVMICGSISLHGRTPLATIKGTLNSQVYCECLYGYLIPTMSALYPDGYVLQEANATVHKTAFTPNWKIDHGIHCLGWPANSLDLNCI